ncbi:ubiquitin-40S ribosomal protein S27a [Hamiltosporidium tvaerminnensis]|nr:ubiquitin-40S ribosomal protein S27a [Hamiltosporidium tvaerminnensis]
MQIFVSIPNLNTEVLAVNDNMKIVDIKRIIEERTSIPVEEQNIVSCNRYLSNESTLSFYNITEMCILTVLFKLVGGGKKKKKKNYTTPKKVKEARKKTKLGCLMQFKINKDGTCDVLRKDCPSCGPGIFMSERESEHKCGKCHTVVPRKGLRM